MAKFIALILVAAILLGSIDMAFSYAYSCDYIDAEDMDECQVTKAAASYNGPESFEDIFAGTPTVAPEYSDDVTRNLAAATLDIYSGIIGSIPVVGSLIDGIFSAALQFFPKPSWQTAVEDLYAALAQEVANLKLYVDGAITELKVEIVSQNLAGLYRAIDNCRVYINADDMVSCMIGARTVILADWQYFMPAIPQSEAGHQYYFPSFSDLLTTATELEYVLPMWRHYGDMIVSTGLELISSERHAGDEAQARAFGYTLIDDISEMIEYYNYAVRIIQTNSVNIPLHYRQVCEIHKGSGCCVAGHVFDHAEIEVDIGPGVSSFYCKVIYRVGCNYPDSMYKAESGAHDSFTRAYTEFSTFRNAALNDYYSTQFGSTISYWTAIKDDLESQLSLVSVHSGYLDTMM